MNLRISENPVLFRWLDINWTLNKCLIVSGVFLILVAGCIFIVLFRHVKGKVERMSKEEIGDSMFNAAKLSSEPRTKVLWVGPAVGVKAEISCNIDTLRQAARRGDRLTFWLWPCLLSCWSLGIWSVLMGIAPLRRDPLLAILITLIPAFILFVAWFMPWAAIYTQIDLNASLQPPAPSGDQAPPPQR